MFNIKEILKEAEFERAHKDIRIHSLAVCIIRAGEIIECYEKKHLNQLQYHQLGMRYAKNLVYEGIRSEDEKVKHLAFGLDCLLGRIKYLKNKAQNE